MKRPLYRGHDRRDRAALSARLDEILAQSRSGEISEDGAVEMVRAEIRWWCAAERQPWPRPDKPFSPAAMIEIAFFPMRFFLRRVEAARDHASIRAVVETITAVLFVMFAWLLLVLFIFPSLVTLTVFAAWVGLQTVYAFGLSVREVLCHRHGKAVPRTDFRDHCMRCHYNLDGLPAAFDAAREIGPERCVECGHPWPRLA